MADILIGFLTVILVLNCFLLILLVLIQLPKKEAGAGIAFGGGATDALFGAGSGTALTKITKYSAALFMGMALLLSVLNANRAGQSKRSLEEELKKKAAAGPVVAPVATNLAVTAPTNVQVLQSTPSNTVPTDTPPAPPAPPEN
jgi:protein translocase SecG subunit